MKELENSGLRDIQDIIDDFIKEVDNNDLQMLKLKKLEIMVISQNIK